MRHGQNAGELIFRIDDQGQRADDAVFVVAHRRRDLHQADIAAPGPAEIIRRRTIERSEVIHARRPKWVSQWTPLLQQFRLDDFVKAIDPKDAYNNKKNKFIGSITFVGPFPSAIEKASRKKILICD